MAQKTAEKLGYTAKVSAHKGDTNTESQLIDTAITNKSKAIILDPANADGSVGSVKKAIAANIPVFIINAELNQSGGEGAAGFQQRRARRLAHSNGCSRWVMRATTLS